MMETGAGFVRKKKNKHFELFGAAFFLFFFSKLLSSLVCHVFPTLYSRSFDCFHYRVILCTYFQYAGHFFLLLSFSGIAFVLSNSRPENNNRTQMMMAMMLVSGWMLFFVDLIVCCTRGCSKQP